MVTETSPWDITQHLKSDDDIAAYLDAVFADGDIDEIGRALGHVARARGMSEIARTTGIARSTLYKALDEGGNPTLSTLFSLMKALNLRLTVSAEA